MNNPNPGLRRTDVNKCAEQLRTGKVRVLNMANIQACPHSIIMAEHYRPDGSCLCDDPNAKIMAEWGYDWDAESKMWGAKGYKWDAESKQWSATDAGAED